MLAVVVTLVVVVIMDLLIVVVVHDGPSLIVELIGAVFTAEVVILAFPADTDCLMFRDGHATDGVSHHLRGWPRLAIVSMGVAMLMIAPAATAGATRMVGYSMAATTATASSEHDIYGHAHQAIVDPILKLGSHQEPSFPCDVLSSS